MTTIIRHRDYHDCDASCAEREPHIADALQQLEKRIAMLTRALQEALVVVTSHHEEYSVHRELAVIHRALYDVRNWMIIVGETNDAPRT